MVTVVSWNIDGWHTIREEQLAVLDRSGADLVLAQEVTPASMALLRESGWEGATALELLPEAHVERGGVRPRFACAVLTRRVVELRSAAVLAEAPSPARTLTAEVDIDGVRVHALSSALPPGSVWGRAAKTGQARTITSHLLHLDQPVVVGMDRNGPKFERWEPQETVWWREDYPEMFAPDAVHGLVDVLVAAYESDPRRREVARRQRPDGPLEVSYLERRIRPAVARRYDVILASRDWDVESVTYDYDAAVAAGSDHAMVTARLAL